MRLRQSTPKRRAQAGYVMMFILFLLAALAIAITAAAPSMMVQIKRDREEELIHRGKQYTHAIRLFYKKTGGYPTSIKQLLDTNHVRFLRREYKDPMTDDGQWTILHAADIKYIPTGFFGQKLTAGTSVVGSSFGSANTTAGGSTASNAANGSSGNGQPPADSNGSNQSSFGSQSVFSNQGSNNSFSSQNVFGNQNSSGGSNSNQTPDANGLVNGQPQSTTGGVFGSSNGQTFGGGPMLGVASTSKEKSIKEIDGKGHYNEWQFFYDPRMEQQFASAATQQVTPGAPQNTNGLPSVGGFGNNPPQPVTQPPK